MRHDATASAPPTPSDLATPCPDPEAAESLPLDDREALGRLLLTLEPRLQAVATRITRNPEAARDVVQNAFEKVLRHGSSFQGQARVSTWLHRIVSNEALMWLRSQRRRNEVQNDRDSPQLDWPADAGSNPDRQIERRQNARRLHSMLGRLCAEERDVLVRCGLNEESYASYSKRAGLHPGAVKTRAFRGRRRLHALLVDS
jgi:RNA polymerase sigma-70 factor (ECF subfamily)